MIILGLGSNMGDRLAWLGLAARKLAPVLRGMRFSRVLESAALLPPDAPKDWDRPFLNMALGGESDLPARALLHEIKAIERDLGRDAKGFWSPRQIDIDILAMDDLLLDTPELHVPHRELLNRDFALLPLLDLAPDWRYPVPGPHYGKPAREIAAEKGLSLGPDLRDTGLALHA